MEFNIGDRVRVIWDTINKSGEYVGRFGNVVGGDKTALTVLVNLDCDTPDEDSIRNFAAVELEKIR